MKVISDHVSTNQSSVKITNKHSWLTDCYITTYSFALISCSDTNYQAKHLYVYVM